MVAPHVGAWIETCLSVHQFVGILLSRPTWARGLKHFFGGITADELKVAPHVGAWIET